MSSDLLKTQFSFIHTTLQKNLAGVTHAEGVALPPSGGSSINWVLGHILKTRDKLLGLLGEEPAADGPQHAVYARGAAALAPAEARPLEELVRDYDRSQVRVFAALDRLTTADLARAVPGLFQKESTLGVELAGLAFHEAYHAGQLGVLRREAGKAGAIG